MTSNPSIDSEHVYNFLLNNLNDRLSIEGFAYEPIKLGGIYWTLTGISLLTGQVNDIIHPRLNRRLEDLAVEIIEGSRNADGGFGNAPGHASSITATHVSSTGSMSCKDSQYAILSLCVLKRHDIIDKKQTAKFISELQVPEMERYCCL